MSKPIIVVGHKNPDNDAISAAVAYANLKNKIAEREAGEGAPAEVYEPARLGPLPAETAWVLERNGIPEPQLLDHLHPRISDVMTPDPISIDRGATMLEAGRELRKLNVRSLVVTEEDGSYHGLITSRAIAERYIAATDALEDGQADEAAVAADLAASLDQKVEDLAVSEAVLLAPDDLLSESFDELMDSPLRAGVVLDRAGKAVGIVTRSDLAVAPKRKVILVDHNELRQAVDGVEDAEVVEVIDHHRIADVSTANPIKFLNLPVGSTATIVSLEYEREGVEITPAFAEVMLSAILTDTVILKSPTATPIDEAQVKKLSAIAGLDAVEFGSQLFKCRGGEAEIAIEDFVGADSKEFQVGDATILIAQHETVDLEGAMEREDEARAYMKRLVAEKGYGFALLMVTDILAEGSQFICEGDCRTVNRAFGIDVDVPGGVWMPGVLSRKKQVAAPILEV